MEGEDDINNMENPASTLSDRSNEVYDGPEDAFIGPDVKVIDLNDTVGNMSMSPSNRDLVLAARHGLFIVDLENTRETPRFLPQGGSWEVADVQWNPHPSSGELIVSASSQKLLIWNLRMRGTTAIQHILSGHRRAVTDINWHPHFENIVVSTSIDGWNLVWDIRDRTKKNVMGMTAWHDAGTQVKWNRQDSHILASSHRGYVLLWDDRKGAIPLSTIQAHHSKIYGIDWSRTSRNEIVTCSLDATIRRFALSPSLTTPDLDRETGLVTPLETIETASPVWRARHLPFGNGVLGLPQRGSSTLEMYRFNNGKSTPNLPVTKYGRNALVKEYVWRTQGGQDPSYDDRIFQLVTLSTDRKVQMEFITPETLESTGFNGGAPYKTWLPLRSNDAISYREPPPGDDEEELLFPDELAFALPQKRRFRRQNRTNILTSPTERYANATATPPAPASSPDPSHNIDDLMSGTPKPVHNTLPVRVRLLPAPTMTLPPKKGTIRKKRGVDQLSWFSSVQVDRERSSTRDDRDDLGTSADDLADQLAMDISHDERGLYAGRRGRDGGSGSNSRSRPSSRVPSQSELSNRSRSLIRSRISGGTRSRSRSGSPMLPDPDPPQDLAAEISSVIRRLAGKVQHEKTEVTNHGKCSFGLHGPWGEKSTKTFLRVTFFNFPKEYPRVLSQRFKPSAEIEKGSEIPNRTRQTLLRGLRRILLTNAPALELCLLYLLGRYEPPEDGLVDEDDELLPGIPADTSNLPPALLIDHQALPRGRHTQGLFGVDGQLLFISRQKVKFVPVPAPPPRPASPTESHSSTMSNEQMSTSGTLLDAMWGLSKLSTDGAFIKRDYVDLDRPRRPSYIGTLIMRPLTRSKTREDPPPPPQYRVDSYDVKEFGAIDRTLAELYKPSISDPALFCTHCESVCTTVERMDYVRTWEVLGSLLIQALPAAIEYSASMDNSASAGAERRVAVLSDFFTVFEQIYGYYLIQKDLQMLAMLAVVLLSMGNLLPKKETATHSHTRRPTTSHPAILDAQVPTLRLQIDYHPLRLPAPAVYTPIQATDAARPAASQAIAAGNSTLSAPASSPSSSGEPSVSSSKQSWPSILTAAHYRNLLGTSKKDKTKPKSSPEPKRMSAEDEPALVSGDITPAAAIVVAEIRKRRTILNASQEMTPAPNQPRSRSSSQAQPQPMKNGISAFNFRARIASITQTSPPSRPIKMQTIFNEPPLREIAFISEELRLQCEFHIRSYADILCRWRMLGQRAEVLKSSRVWRIDEDSNLTITPLCKACGRASHRRGARCTRLRTQGGTLEPRCTVCRLPVKRLGRTCLHCMHVSHFSCLETLPEHVRTRCPSGCGCHCSVDGRNFEVDVVRRRPPPLVSRLGSTTEIRGVGAQERSGNGPLYYHKR